MTGKPQTIYRWTAIGWLACVVVHMAWSVFQLRNQPPTDEVYAQTLPFQVASFAFTSLPYWLGVLLVVLIVEFAIFGRKAR